MENKPGPFHDEKSEKVSQCQKKLKGVTLWDCSTSNLSENIKKLKGDPLVKSFFSKKVSQSQKYSKEYPLAPLIFLNDVKSTYKLLKK